MLDLLCQQVAEYYYQQRQENIMALPEQTLEALTNGHKNMDFNENGEMTSASGSGVDLYVLISLVSWIKLELKTGMKMTRHGSTLKKAKLTTSVKQRHLLGFQYLPSIQAWKQQALDHNLQEALL
jgi:hypothetical protein